jgi:hypothetical protein
VTLGRHRMGPGIGRCALGLGLRGSGRARRGGGDTWAYGGASRVLALLWQAGFLARAARAAREPKCRLEEQL